MKSKLEIVRQGDVCLIRVANLPAGAVEVPGSGDVILAYGEVTGHAHRIKQADDRPSARVFDYGAERYLQIAEKIALTHEEHSAIMLDSGIYRQVYQFEEKRAEIRRVVD